jgi:hypothetical protein
MWKKGGDLSYVGFTEDGAQWLVDNTDIKLVGKKLSTGQHQKKRTPSSIRNQRLGPVNTYVVTPANIMQELTRYQSQRLITAHHVFFKNPVRMQFPESSSFCL